MLIMISVYGLRPQDYLKTENPAFKALVDRSAYALSSEPIYPSVTFTNHAALATGVSSDRHGIFANTRFDPADVIHWLNGESQQWYLESKYLKVPTLWTKAHSFGLNVALLRWPVTLDAKLKWLMPEVFPIQLKLEGTPWEILSRFTTPALIEALENLPGFVPPVTHQELDQMTCHAALHLAEIHLPDLMMMHFTSLDHEMIFPTKNGQSVKPQFRTDTAQSQRAICSQVSNEYESDYKMPRPIQK